MSGQLPSTRYITSVADFYSLTRDQLLALEGVKAKSADNMLSAIEASKHRAFSRLLFGLNIRDVGEKTAQILANAFGDVDKLLGASEEEIVAVPGTAPKIGHSAYDRLHNQQ